MAFEENSRTYVEQVRTGGDFDLLPELMAEECPIMGTDIVVTPEMHEDTLRRLHAAFPDYEVVIDDLWFDEDSDMGVIHVTESGTFENELVLKPDWEGELTFEPTGESFEFSGVYIGKFDGDKVVEMGGYIEELEMFTQLGILPELSELAA